MKQWLFLVLVTAQFLWAQPVVFDEANLIPANHEAVLERIIWEWNQQTKHQMAVVTVRSLNNRSIEDVATDRFAALGIGRKEEDDGILFLVAPNERKLRIEIGYGLEGFLPDGLVGEIRDQYIIPFFRKNDYVSGILYGTKALILMEAQREGIELPQLGQDRLPQQPQRRQRRGGSGIFGFLFLFFILSLFRRGGRRGGLGMLPWLLLGSTFSSSSRHGSFSDFGGGFGGFGGGFGGGFSGGGGASGSW